MCPTATADSVSPTCSRPTRNSFTVFPRPKGYWVTELPAGCFSRVRSANYFCCCRPLPDNCEGENPLRILPVFRRGTSLALHKYAPLFRFRVSGSNPTTRDGDCRHPITTTTNEL